MLIYRYILKAHFAPFILSFFIVIFVFTFQFIMKFIDNLIGKGLSWWVISQLITLNLCVDGYVSRPDGYFNCCVNGFWFFVIFK